jgi:hypothetical protein
MRSVLAGLFALTMFLDLPSAKAAMQVSCNWEGRIPVAITVEGDASAFISFGPSGFAHSSYYLIEVTNSGVWMLLNEPKPVLGIRMVGPRQPIDLALSLDAGSRRCWK